MSDMSIPTTINVQKKLLPGVDVQPLYLDPENGIWVLRVQFAPGITLPRHFHTGTVHLWTLSGRWNYVEHPDEPQTAGCYLFEPGGSIHTFHTPPTNTEITDTFMVVTGSNINYDDEGNLVGVMDAGWIEQTLLETAAQQGLGKPRYVRPGGNRFSDE